jgi:hypothetical protein
VAVLQRRPVNGDNRMIACRLAYLSNSPAPPSLRVARWFRRAAALPFALLILFEEWGWEPLARLMASFARLRLVAWVERRIAALPPYAALGVFALPWLLFLPTKLFALWLIAEGRSLLGVVAILVAKVVGTAIVARLFTLTKPALMRLPWFATCYTRWRTWKEGLLAWVRASELWGWGRAIRRSLLRHLKRWRACLLS